MTMAFTKMHGLGNDFVVIDAIKTPVSLVKDECCSLADRHTGIGCDQLLLIEPSEDPKADFSYRIFNADGSEAQQCGNGSRCIARYLIENEYIKTPQLRLKSKAGIMNVTVFDFDHICVDMGQPILEPHLIPFNEPKRAKRYILQVFETEYPLMAVSMGNPHAVLKVDDVCVANVAHIGPVIEHHADFPEGTNVGFMEVISPTHIKLRVHERGTGETQACGSGACAAVVAGILSGELSNKVSVELPGGELMIEWQGEGHPVLMTGPAVSVFKGYI